MSKTFVYDRFDVCVGTVTSVHVKPDMYTVPGTDGEYIFAEDAINREAVLQSEIRTLQVQLKEAKAGASFEFDHCGITHTVRASNESIKALLAWRKHQETVTNNALRMATDARRKSPDVRQVVEATLNAIHEYNSVAVPDSLIDSVVRRFES